MLQPRTFSTNDRAIPFPCVVKAPDRQGQRGLTLVREPSALAPAVEAAIAESRGGGVLVEELIEGPELTVNAVSRGGEFFPLTVTDRILADARAEKQTVVSLDSRRRVSPVLAAVTAVAAAVAIGLGIYAVSLNNDLDSTRTALTAQENAAALLADPSATSVALQSGTGRLVVGSDGEAVLVLNDLPPAPAGKTYQAWIVDDQTPVSAGTFESTSDQAVVPIPQAVPAGAVVAVTVEQSGGASSPTLPPLAASEPV